MANDYKMYTIKVKKGSAAYNWLESQNKYSESARKAFEIMAAAHGNKDINQVLIEREVDLMKNGRQHIENPSIKMTRDDRKRDIDDDKIADSLGMLTAL